MSIEVFLAVLGAALLHAAWNALVKVSADRLVLVAVIKLGTTAVALAALPFIELPPPEAWPYVAASVVIHTGYFLFLVIAYRFGDLSQVYPIARGAAPLLVAALAVLLFGETLSGQNVLALLLISCGIMSLMLVRRTDGMVQVKAVVAALATSCFTAGYTLADGMGARLSANPHDYILWLNVFNGLPIIAIALFARRGNFAPQLRKVWKPGLLSGAVALLAYWIVLWASTQAPIALVAAVREASIVFAVMFGVVFLKERLDLRRMIAVFLTTLGLVFLKAGK
jgi:drug/metabolite transporter (DMT)-like permease